MILESILQTWEKMPTQRRVAFPFLHPSASRFVVRNLKQCHRFVSSSYYLWSQNGSQTLLPASNLPFSKPWYYQLILPKT